MVKNWICKDCGKEYPYSLLDKENEIREKKNNSIKARFVSCKNSGYHIPGVAAKVYKLNEEKLRKAIFGILNILDDYQDVFPDIVKEWLEIKIDGILENEKKIVRAVCHNVLKAPMYGEKLQDVVIYHLGNFANNLKRELSGKENKQKEE